MATGKFSAPAADGVAPDADLAWVRELNRLAVSLDAHAAAIHPAAWHEQLGPDMDRWLRLARHGPPSSRQSTSPDVTPSTLPFKEED